MTRKFKTEPVSAGAIDKLAEQAGLAAWRTVDRINGTADRSEWKRGKRLLLHWWGVGHNPARNVATCRECGGKRSTREIVWINGAAHWRDMDCKACNGTGKAVKL